MLNSNQHEENTIKLRFWRVKTRDVECDDEVESDIIGKFAGCAWGTEDKVVIGKVAR